MAAASINNKQGGSGSREYCLRWNNHQPNMVQFFGSLYSTETFVDVTLVSAEGKKVHAHKLVLSACSPYFQHVFENHPCKHPIVILKDVQHADLQTIVSFIYNGEVNISQDRINVILKTANSLQVKGLAEVPADELKRVSSGTNETTKTQQPPPLTSAASWSLGDASDPGSEIPRKKLKKSTSAAAAYHSSSNSTNGDHSSSVDSGVGASVSRSIDEGPCGASEELSVVQKRPSLPAPPPLLPKSRSLDHNLIRDSHGDSEMSMGHHDGHSYDDSSVGMDRGYEIEGSDLKIEGISDDGEIEFLEEEDDDYDEEAYGNYPNPDYDHDDGSIEPQERNQTRSQQSHPQSSTTVSSSPLYRQPLRVSSAAGERRRRGRPLLRQPRIKRSDNEPSPGGGREQFGTELYISEPLGGGGGNESNGHNLITTTEHGRISPSGSADRKQCPQIHQSNLPIVRVSQCSPTPPSSPPPDPSSHTYKEEQSPVIVSSISFPSSTIIPTITQAPHVTTTLLTVPNVSESQPSLAHSSSGSHLVKQISQPHLPSHTVVPLGGITTGNPVIRRQYSTPIPGQQSRIVQTLKQGTLLQILPSETNYKDEEGDRTYVIDLVPSTYSGKDSGSPSQRRELKREGSNEQSAPSSSLSREDSLVEETGSNSASFDDGLPINRSGHCPALRPGPALGCNFCWNSVDTCGRILRRKTKYHCPECHINLCIVPCFQEYHEKTDKKKRPRSKLGLPKPSSM